MVFALFLRIFFCCCKITFLEREKIGTMTTIFDFLVEIIGKITKADIAVEDFLKLSAI